MTSQPLTKILMVEDEPDIQSVARLALEAVGGFTVHICGSGADAIQDGPAFAPDLVLLDVMMPGMDGPTTYTALRALPNLAGTPMIFMTAKVQPQEIAQYKDMGVVDVIAKPFNPMTLSTTITAIWERWRAASAGAELRVLADEYVARIPEKLAQIEHAWAAALRGGNQADLEALYRLTHGLHGSGATFGFEALSAASAELEQALAPLRSRASPSADQRIQVARLIAALKQAALAAIPGLSAEAGGERPASVESAAARPSPVAPTSASAGEREDRLICIAEVDPGTAHDLVVQLGHFGYAVHTQATLDDRCGAVVPAAIIVGAAALNLNTPSAAALVATRRAGVKAPATVVVSERGDLETRLSAVRAGADAFFTIPVNTIALIDKLDTLTSHQAPEPNRILVVDDEPDLAEYHAATLRQAGMMTFVVNDPLDVMRPLGEFRPDMILMDMYMPGCDGMDLAAVIRQQEDYIGIPIVFLSAETNRDMQLEAMRLGGDDFMTKPIKPDHLISAVNSRVQRSRALRSFMVRDSLTGLFNHTATKERLEVELARAVRHQAPLAFAIIDIDNFKQVNDTFGHPIGDRVLKSLARLLQQRLRRTDVIGRYGGEEFAVVLAGTDGPSAVRVIDEIRSGLAQIRQQAGAKEFSVTFSCGIASFPTHQDPPSLTDAADRALYQAKRGGRNQVLLASM